MLPAFHQNHVMMMLGWELQWVSDMAWKTPEKCKRQGMVRPQEVQYHQYQYLIEINWTYFILSFLNILLNVIVYIRLVFDNNVYIFLCWFDCFVNTTSWWITVNTFGLFLSALHQELHRHFPRSRSPVPTSQELWCKDVSFIVCIYSFQTSKRDILFLDFF